MKECWSALERKRVDRDAEETKQGKEASIESMSTCPEGDNRDQAQMRALRKATRFEGPMAQLEI